MPKTALKLETRSIHNLLQIERNAQFTTAMRRL